MVNMTQGAFFLMVIMEKTQAKKENTLILSSPLPTFYRFTNSGAVQYTHMLQRGHSEGMS